MSLSVTNYGNNPQQPGIAAEAYIPDQLIAGNLKLVTSPALITGAAALLRGTVLGQVTVGAVGPAVATGGNTGNGAITVPVAGVRAKPGTYTIRMTGATTYNVINPFGVELNPGYAAGAYVDAELGFTFTAGGTPMVAGDSFTIPVAAGSGSYKKSVATAVDGSQIPLVILADDADASGGDVTSGVYQMGEFNGNAVIFDGSFTLAGLTTLLRPYSIFLKTFVSAADPT